MRGVVQVAAEKGRLRRNDRCRERESRRSLTFNLLLVSRILYKLLVIQ